MNHWKSFFKDHKTYHKVGRVQHPPIDPASPIPEHCNPKEAKKDDSADGKKKTAEFAGPQGGSKSGSGSGSAGSSSSQEKKKKREEL